MAVLTIPRVLTSVVLLGVNGSRLAILVVGAIELWLDVLGIFSCVSLCDLEAKLKQHQNPDLTFYIL